MTNSFNKNGFNSQFHRCPDWQEECVGNGKRSTVTAFIITALICVAPVALLMLAYFGDQP